jgi:hypothetical protein
MPPPRTTWRVKLCLILHLVVTVSTQYVSEFNNDYVYDELDEEDYTDFVNEGIQNNSSTLTFEIK